MSIVAAAEAPDALAVALWAGVMLAIGLGLAHWVGVFRNRNVVGPVRWNAGEPLGGLFIVAAVGMVVWYAAQVALASIIVAANGTAPTTQAMDRLTAQDWATLATVPGILALVVLVLGDRLLGKEMIDRLGYGLRELFHGPWAGIVGLVVLIPLLFALASVAELVYRLIGFEHPAAHAMLLKMSEAPGGWGRWGLVLGAVVVAPLFEEMLFRGHLQTLLAAFFDRFASRPSVVTPNELAGDLEAGKASGFPVVGVAQEAVIPYAARDNVAWPRWAAILTAALLFTAVHATWTAPPVFLLAVAMGYAYERTGNLWVSIIMHALFNGLSTAIYLNMPAQ